MEALGLRMVLVGLRPRGVLGLALDLEAGGSGPDVEVLGAGPVVAGVAATGSGARGARGRTRTPEVVVRAAGVGGAVGLRGR
ncbi:hypothetical protein, partial [Streptomyces rhizosphaericola]